MGNELCVASGGTPNLLDMVVTNNTEIPLQLDTTEDCRRDCRCKGYQVAAGKIVEGRQPPDTVSHKCTNDKRNLLQIDPFSSGKFSVSGREATLVAPNGKVFYANEEVKLKVAICWSGAGPTSLAANSATVRCQASHAVVPRIMFLFPA